MAAAGTMWERARRALLNSVSTTFLRLWKWLRAFWCKNGLLTLSMLSVATGCLLGFLLRALELTELVRPGRGRDGGAWRGVTSRGAGETAPGRAPGGHSSKGGGSCPRKPLSAQISPWRFSFFSLTKKLPKLQDKPQLPPPPAAGGSGTDPEGLQEPPGGTGKGEGTWGCWTLGHRLPQRRWAPRDEPLLLLHAKPRRARPKRVSALWGGPRALLGSRGASRGHRPPRTPGDKRPGENAPERCGRSQQQVSVPSPSPRGAGGTEQLGWGSALGSGQAGQARPGDAAWGERSCCGNILVSPAGI